MLMCTRTNKTQWQNATQSRPARLGVKDLFIYFSLQNHQQRKADENPRKIKMRNLLYTSVPGKFTWRKCESRLDCLKFLVKHDNVINEQDSNNEFSRVSFHSCLRKHRREAETSQKRCCVRSEGKPHLGRCRVVLSWRNHPRNAKSSLMKRTS